MVRFVSITRGLHHFLLFFPKLSLGPLKENLDHLYREKYSLLKDQVIYNSLGMVFIDKLCYTDLNASLFKNLGF